MNPIACLLGLAVISDFMQQRVKPFLDPESVLPRDRNIIGMFFRAIGWMQTTKRLDNPGDFQAILTTVRTLLEISVDLIFLGNEPGPNNAAMETWEKATMLKAARALQNYFVSHKLPIPPECQPMVDFILQEGKQIDAQRKALWGNTAVARKGQSGRAMQGC